jgi:hypothetical protein
MSALLKEQQDQFPVADNSPPQGSSSNLDEVMKQAVGQVFDLKDRGNPIHVEAKGTPYDTLVEAAEQWRTFGATHDMADAIKDALETELTQRGVDVTRNSGANWMELKVSIEGQEPELDTGMENVVIAYDRNKKYGAEFSTMVVDYSIHGTKSTATNAIALETMFTGRGEEYLFFHFRFPKGAGGLKGVDNNGSSLQSNAAEVASVGLLEAAGPGVKAVDLAPIRKEIQSGTISPEQSQLIQTVASLNRTVETIARSPEPVAKATEIIKQAVQPVNQALQNVTQSGQLPKPVVLNAVINSQQRSEVVVVEHKASQPQQLKADNSNTVSAVATAPVQASPVQVAPAQAASVQSAPVQQAPVQATPAVSAPVQQAPVASDVAAPVTAGAAAPIEVISAQVAPIQVAPAQITPVQSTSVLQAPVQQAPVQQSPAVSAPLVSAPASVMPVQQAPAQVAPVQTALVQTAPVQEAPVVAMPVTPVQQAPVEAVQEAEAKKTDVAVEPKIEDAEPVKPKALDTVFDLVVPKAIKVETVVVPQAPRSEGEATSSVPTEKTIVKQVITTPAATTSAVHTAPVVTKVVETVVAQQSPAAKRENKPETVQNNNVQAGGNNAPAQNNTSSSSTVSAQQAVTNQVVQQQQASQQKENEAKSSEKEKDKARDAHQRQQEQEQIKAEEEKAKEKRKIQDMERERIAREMLGAQMYDFRAWAAQSMQQQAQPAAQARVETSMEAPKKSADIISIDSARTTAGGLAKKFGSACSGNCGACGGCSVGGAASYGPAPRI